MSDYRTSSLQHGHARNQLTSFSRLAFTVTELLVVVAITALLVGIFVPVLASTFTKSKEIASAVNMRSISQIFDMYASQNRGLYPAAVPDRVYPTPRPAVQVTVSHWNTSDQWHLLFLEDHPWESNIDFYLSPGANRDIDMQSVMTPIFPSFRYSASFLGNPLIWSGDQVNQDDWQKLERSVLQSTVRYPSAKVLLWDAELPNLRRELERDVDGNLKELTPMVFADSHVETHVPADATDSVINWAPTARYGDEKLHNTRDGVYGRDY